MRIVAAILVMFQHSFSITTGDMDNEPLRAYLGMGIGSIAVDIFFITSGFLVVKSLITKNSLKGFIFSRVIRIYPALIVSVVLTTVILEAYFNADNFFRMFMSVKTMKYLFCNSTIIFRHELRLPGVFLKNPFGSMVNASLWTLRYEVQLYSSLVVFAMIATIFTNNKIKFLKIVLLLAPVAVLGTYAYAWGPTYVEDSFLRLFYLFYTGGAYYIIKDRVLLEYKYLILALVAIVLSVSVSKDMYICTYITVVPYVVLFLAYVPSGQIRKYNEVGDYSYGMYIYAWPIQQFLVALFKGINAFQMFVLSFLITFVFAYISWHVVEKRCLILKSLKPRCQVI
jgi:peptidoglycan/LPS O-acetylase OafA/YrhL